MNESSRREERGGTTGEVGELIGATIAAHIAPEARVVAVREREGGAQGFSGAALRYYDVTYSRSGAEVACKIHTPRPHHGMAVPGAGAGVAQIP